MTENIIIPEDYDVYWEKWVDPYEITFRDNDNEDDFLDDDDVELEEEIFQSKQIKSIITPFGLLPLTEQSLVSNHFKLWVGHTNFKFTEDFCDILRVLPGIEAADLVTNYRFKIAIGKLFTDRVIMNNTKEKLVSYARTLYGPFSEI